ncbi:lipopolysaccharide biosynthesis protein [Actinomycetospora flava]|uniref:O-antigen/teichoic acid export membrane protein n=1 Tax=Actinomycetospora flava TaxID=3129232 RepID=A0ABU8M4U1_9PSEU
MTAGSLDAHTAALRVGNAPAPSRRARLRAHLTDPFSRNSYALIVNTVMTGLLGLVFWFLAARFYTPVDVGRSSALISAMTLLSAIVGINITGTLSRFLPRSGARTARLVLVSYGLSSLAVAVLATGFVLTLGWWGPSFGLLASPWAAIGFVGVAVAANIFTVQDGVLVGLRGASWVALENTVFGVVKAGLLILLATTMPATGVYVAWIVPMILLCLPVNLLVFARRVPRHARETADAATTTGSEIRGFLAGDFVGALFGFGAIYLVPVIVAAALPPSTFAVFFIAWMIAGVLNLVANNLAQTLTVEGVFDAARLARYARSALVRSTVLLGAAAAALLVLARPMLAFLGPDYAAAAPLLQLLALGALGRAVMEVWLGVLRAQGRARSIVRWQVASGTVVVGTVVAGLFLGGGTLGMPIDPVTGVGVLVLVSQVAVALVVLPRLLRVISVKRADRFNPWTPPTTTAPARPTTSPTATGRRLVPLKVVVRAPATAEAPEAPPPEKRPAPSRGRRFLQAVDRQGPAVIVAVASLLSLVMIVEPLGRVDLAAMDGWGLVSVLPVVTLAGIALLLVSVVAAIALARERKVLLTGQLVAVCSALHGLTALIEPLPRFPTSYVHLGFVDFISRFGTVAPDVDARFSWPGFFALVSFVSDGAAPAQLLPLVQWTPLLSNLLYLLALWLILRNLRISWRGKWFAALLFTVLQWIGQDYFSPQGFTFLLYMIFIGILLTWFRPVGREAVGQVGRPAWVDGAWRRTPSTLRRAGGATRRFVGRVVGTPTHAGERAARPSSPATRIALLGLLLVIFAAATVSHQLTPFVMVVAAGALALGRRSTLRGLPVLLGVLMIAWVSLMTAAYWTGHLTDVLGGVGDLSGNVATSIAARAGGDVAHSVVLMVRVALFGVLAVGSVVGLWRRRHRGVDDRAVLLLLAVPFLAVLVQNYGGEIGLRVYMFALPGACVLLAMAFFPETARGTGFRAAFGSVWRYVAAGLVVLVLGASYGIAAYGNEAFERVTPGEMAAVQWVYDRPGDAQVLFLTDSLDSGATPMMPIGYTDTIGVGVRAAIASPNAADNTGVVMEQLTYWGGSTYFMTSTAEERYLEISAGYPAGWGQQFRAALAADPRLEKVLDTGDAQVYVPRNPQAYDPITGRVPERLGVRIGPTEWTPVGVTVLIGLVGVLLTLQVRALRRSGRAALRTTVFVWGPLLLVFAAVVVERLFALT